MRTLAFLFQFHDLCELLAEEARQPFTELLEKAWPGMAAAWEAITAVEIADP